MYKFFLVLLAATPVFAANLECGNQASLPERIADCKTQVLYANQANNQIVVWKLLSRKYDSSLKKFYEVWQDSFAGVVWGDRLDSLSSQLDLTSQCSSEESLKAAAGIKELNFSFPTKDDFQQAMNDGITAVLPNLRSRFFWSSTPGWGLDINSHYGATLHGKSSEQLNSVRCIAR